MLTVGIIAIKASGCPICLVLSGCALFKFGETCFTQLNLALAVCFTRVKAFIPGISLARVITVGAVDGSYRYDSSQRNARYEGFNTREAYGQREIKLSETGLAKLKQSTTTQNQTDRTARSFDRYDAYSKHGHTLHSSRYRSYHHSQRSPRNQANPSSF